jgi:hypothetical protein
MIFTNKYNMPEMFVAYCKAKFERELPVTRTHIGVTSLIDSAWKAHLTRKHNDEITVDISDLFFAFRGEFTHEAAEAVDMWNVLSGKFEMPLKYKDQTINLRGVADQITPYTITDHKTMKVSGIWYMDKDKYVEQVNLYKYMAEKLFGLPINRLCIDLYFMDWSQAMVGSSSSYPKAPSLSYEVPVWSEEQAEAYIWSRMGEHFADEKDIPLCTPKERWKRDAVFAVMKKGNKKSTKNCNTMEEAIAFASDRNYILGKTHDIETREGIDARCVNFCSCNTFCSYWQENYAGKEIDSVD